MRVAALVFMASLLANAETLDRVAVSVGKDVITLSDIDRQIRVTAMLNGERPKFSKQERRKAADRLVEQLLIRREMNSPTFLALSSDKKGIDPAIDQIVKTRYPNATQYRTALDQYRTTDQNVQNQLEWMTKLSQFVDARFRPGVQIPANEAKEYYETTWLPTWKDEHKGAPPTFEEAQEQVEEMMISERANAAMDRWLGQTRTQTPILYHSEAFQ